MKFDCLCGRTIFDGTDGLGHKGQVIADRDWARFWEALDTALERPGGAAAQAMALRKLARARPLYECPGCGRLWAFDASGGLLGYTPENGRHNRVLAR